MLEPGHSYLLNVLDDHAALGPVRLEFVKRDHPPEKYPGNVGHHSGTTIQEVMRAVIDRLKYVNDQIPCSETGHAIADARSLIWWLEKRAARVHGRDFDLRIYDIEDQPTCPTCGHIGCNQTCR